MYNLAMILEEKVLEIIKRLSKIYPNPKTALLYSTPWELLVATILSAQATDKSVNLITPNLFKQFPDVSSFANSQIEEIDPYIKTITFHQAKARNIIGAAKMIIEKFDGKVPDNMENLDSLPGVARKTANVVLGDAFNKQEGIVVDTHVMRLSGKLGLTTQKDPVKIEQDLMKIVPKKDWTRFSHLLILHGRDICTARPHTCKGCPLENICPDMKS
jgi:endonuclease III